MSRELLNRNDDPRRKNFHKLVAKRVTGSVKDMLTTTDKMKDGPTGGGEP